MVCLRMLLCAPSGMAAVALGAYGAHMFKPENPAYKDVSATVPCVCPQASSLINLWSSEKWFEAQYEKMQLLMTQGGYSMPRTGSSRAIAASPFCASFHALPCPGEASSRKSVRSAFLPAPLIPPSVPSSLQVFKTGKSVPPCPFCSAIGVPPHETTECGEFIANTGCSLCCSLKLQNEQKIESNSDCTP